MDRYDELKRTPETEDGNGEKNITVTLKCTLGEAAVMETALKKYKNQRDTFEDSVEEFMDGTHKLKNYKLTTGVVSGLIEDMNSPTYTEEPELTEAAEQVGKIIDINTQT